MNSKRGSLALTTLEASGPLGRRKLGALEQPEGTAAPPELLTLPAVERACCSSTCSSSSTPGGTNESAGKWGSTGALLESPTSRGQRCEGCLGPCCSRCEADSSNRCSSICSSPISSGSLKWWEVQQSCSCSNCCCSVTKDMACSTVCSTSSRPQERQSSLVYTSTEPTETSSNCSNGDNCKKSCSTNCKGGSPSCWEYRWRGRMNLFLKRAVLGERKNSTSGNSTRSTSYSGCCSAANPGAPEATIHEQQHDNAPSGLLKGAAEPAPSMQEAAHEGAPSNAAPLAAFASSWKDIRVPRGLHAEARSDRSQETSAAETGITAAVANPESQQPEQPKQQQPLLLLRAVKQLRSCTPKPDNSNTCGDSSGIDNLVRQPLRPLPVAYSSSYNRAEAGAVTSETDSAAAKLSSAAAATPTATATTPTALPTTPAAAATPTTAATTPTAAAATPMAASVTHTGRITSTAAQAIAGAASTAATATPLAAAASTIAASTTAAKILPAAPAAAETTTKAAGNRPSEPSFSTSSGGSAPAICQQAALPCEPRLCYCLEHLLAGLCWGPPCLCEALQDSVRWGFGGTCTVDRHLVNPQQELELLLQRAAATAPVGAETAPQATPPKKTASDFTEGPCAAQKSGEGGLWSLAGDSLLPMRITVSTAEGDSFACASWSRSVPEEGSVPLLSGVALTPPHLQSCCPISDWGSPAQQWAVPQRTDFDGPESSSSKMRSWNHTLVKKRGYGMGSFYNEEKEECRSYLGLFAPLLGFEGPPRGGSQVPSRYPRTALCADAFVCSGVQWFGSSEDEAGESGAEGGGSSFLPLASCSARFCGGKTLEAGKLYIREGRRRRDGGVRDRNKMADGLRSVRDSGNSMLYASSKRNAGATFCLRANAHQQLPSPTGGPATAQGAGWGDIREPDRSGKFTGGPEGTSGCGGSRWRDGGREESNDAVCSSSSSTHQTVLEIAAVPVRTRKGFRKPLPLPPEMLAAIAAAGPRRPVEPVLQYDGESREWR